MSNPNRRLLVGVGLLAVTLAIAVGGYVAAGWSLLDSVYMVVITVFGVGYGEVQPITSPSLRIFTMFVIVAGYASAVYIIGGFFQMVAEGQINRLLGDRRMAREIESLSEHVIVCGYGRIGRLLANELQGSDIPFIVIDANPSRIESARKLNCLCKLADAAEEETLLAAGIDRARTLATVLPDDAVNVFVTLTARQLNPRLQIVARGEYPSTEKKLLQAGADRVVLPTAIGAVRIAHMITRPTSVGLLELGSGIDSLNEQLEQIDVRVDDLPITADCGLAGLTLGEIELKGKATFLVAAIRKSDGLVVRQPGPDERVDDGDALVIVGRRGNIPEFMRRHVKRRDVYVRGTRVRVTGNH